MVKKIFAIAILFALVAVAVVQAVEKENEREAAEAEEANAIPAEQIPGIGVGLKSPDFELKTLEGEAIRLSDLEGKKVMINFWATWCPPCKAEMPDMQKLYEEKGNDIHILAVNIDPEYDVAGFAKDMQLTFPILLDEKDQVMKTYQILTIPTTYFLDEKGIIQDKFMGAMNKDKMEEIINNL